LRIMTWYLVDIGWLPLSVMPLYQRKANIDKHLGLDPDAYSQHLMQKPHKTASITW
jgi:hypothetical protein